jgi:hypothetical protein
MSRSGRDPQKHCERMTDQEIADSYLELIRLRQTIRIAECGRRLQSISAPLTVKLPPAFLLQ